MLLWWQMFFCLFFLQAMKEQVLIISEQIAISFQIELERRPCDTIETVKGTELMQLGASQESCK